jgi:hypothetical protein
MLNKSQMELQLIENQKRTRFQRRVNRSKRAQWWFEQMRRVVDEAVEWQPDFTVRSDSAPLQPGSGCGVGRN